MWQLIELTVSVGVSVVRSSPAPLVILVRVESVVEVDVVPGPASPSPPVIMII